MKSNENIGKLAGQTRKSCGIKAKDLCAGICSESMLKKIEANAITADYLLMNRLFARMGKAINQIALLLSQDDYLEYCYQQNFLYLLQERQIPQLRELLEEYRQSDIKESPLRLQCLYLYTGICEILCKEQQKAIHILRDAIEVTLPQFSMQKIEQYVLARDEISLILLWLQQRGLAGDKNAVEEVRMLCMELEKRHFDIHVWDVIFPQVVLVWRQLALYHGESVEKKELDLYCEKAFTLLSEEMRLFYVPQFLKIKIEILKSRNDKEAIQREKQRNALRKIYDTYGEKYPEDEIPLWGNCRQQRIFQINKTLRTERHYRELLQEEISDMAEIDTKTLSRIETGTTIPKRGTLQKIMDAMDMEQHLYSTEIDVTDFSQLELLEKKKMAISRNNTEEEIIALEEMKKQLPKSRKNQQYLDFMETELNVRRGILSNKEALSRYISIFERTRKFEPEKFSKIRLNQIETNLIYAISLIYYMEGRFLEERQLVENVFRGYDFNGIDATFYTGDAGLLLGHLTMACARLEQYEEARAYCQRGIRLQLKNGTGFVLAHLQSRLCFLEEDSGCPQEHCIKIYEELYHLLSIWRMEKECTIIKTHCEEEYNTDTSNW